MTNKWLAWCGVPLVNHSISTARISCLLFAKRWEWRSKKARNIHVLLPMASLFHDIGKAEKYYVEKALNRCNKGQNPSFYAHEIFSAATISHLAHKLLPKGCGLGEKYILVSSVLLHHHGMKNRYSRSLENLLYLASRGEYNELQDLIDKMENLEGPLKALSLLQEYLKRDYLPECNGLLKEAEIREIESTGQGSIATYTALGGLYYTLFEKTPEQEHYKVSSTVLTSFVSIADSLSALFERNRKPGEKPMETLKRNRNRYAVRVLREMLTGRKLEVTVKKIHEIVANPIPTTKGLGKNDEKTEK